MGEEKAIGMPVLARTRDGASATAARVRLRDHLHTIERMPLLRLHLLRHGQTNASRGNLFCGRRLDPPLTEEGLAMAAALLISDGMNRPYPVATIIEHARTEQLGAGRMVVHLPDTGRPRSECQKTADGWKFAITEAMVDEYVRQSRQRIKAGR